MHVPNFGGGGGVAGSEDFACATLPTTNFFVSLGIAKILGFSELSVYTEVVLLKTFPQHVVLYLYCKY